MISLVKYVYGFVSNNNNNNNNNKEDQYKTELANEIAKLDAACEFYDKNRTEEIETVEVELSNCFQYVGTITQLEANHGVIDDIHCFDMKAATKVQGLTIGCKVSYLAYKHSEDIPIKIVKIQHIIHEMWEKPTEEETKEILNGLQNEKPEYFTIHQRSILGLIVERRGGLLTVDTDNNEPIIVDLDNVKSQFVPMVGDQVYLNCNVQSDMSFVDMVGEILDIISVHPARSKTTKGIVTKCDYDRRTGEVNRTYFFNFDTLDMTYVRPQIGDEVVVDAIESEQGSLFWRCLKVVLLIPTQRNDEKSADILLKSDLTENKNGIVLSNIERLIFDGLQQTIEVKLTVKNTNDQPIRIMKSYFTSKKFESQIELVKPKAYETFSIEGNAEMDYNFKVTSKFFGESREMFVICFGGYVKISRYFEIDVGDEKNGLVATIGTGPNVYRNIAYTKQVWENKYEVIPGGKIKKSPNFVFVRFGMWEVPNALKSSVLSLHTSKEVNEKLSYILPFFNEPLNYGTFRQCFHNLLYLEEITCFHNIRRYDRDRAHFKREKEFLALEVENIAETRPSLVLGDSVRARNPWDNNNEQHCFEGIIHKVLHDRILLKFTQSFHDKYHGEDYRLEFFFSRSSLRKQHHAIEKSYRKLGQEFLFPSQIRVQEPQLNVQLVDGEMEKIVETGNERLPWYNGKLNNVQKEAVKQILRGEARPMPYIIFGPPGTGKTITVIETILQICTQISDSRILVGTPSNSSANLITERIIESKVLQPGDFLRVVGQNAVEQEIIPEHLLPYCATCDIAAERTVKNEMIVTESGLKLRCGSSFIGRHRITIGTCSTLGTLMQMEFPRDHFTHVVIDEAGQCLEPEALIPMTMLNRSTGQIIMAGDPMQLGPIVLSRYAGDRGLDTSFLVRLLERFPYQKDVNRFQGGYDPRLVTKLIYNYRSMPSILKLFSDLFYNGDLQPMISDTESKESKMLRMVSEILPNPMEKTENHATYFVGIKGVNKQSLDSPSWFNSAEAKSIYFFLLKLYKIGIKHTDIGIITPYLQQVKAIRMLINDSNLLLPKVGTVEEFQGQERMIILVSTVRSSSKQIANDHKHFLGFVKSAKRMNVAISRPKSLLVVFGNPHLLILDSNWKHLIKYCVRNNTYTGCDLPDNLKKS